MCRKAVFSFNKSVSSKSFLSTHTDIALDIRTILNCLLFEQILFQKYKYTKSKKSIASFYVKKNMKLGFKLTMRNLNLFDFFVNFFVFSYSNHLSFRGFYINPLLINHLISLGQSEFSNFSTLGYDFHEWTSFYLFEKNGMTMQIYANYLNVFIINFFFSHFESSFF
jgi:hypothetical protein